MSDQQKIFPLFYLGPIEYYQQLIDNKVTLEKHENFVKQTYRNRCTIYGANGKLNLIIPLERTGSRRTMNDIKVSQEERWQHLHWKSLQAAYRSSPYFEFYEDDFISFYEKKYKYLVDINTDLLLKVNELLGISQEIVFTEKYTKTEPELDYRSKFSAKEDPQIVDFTDKEYIQVFSNKHGFISNLSIVDLLFNEGPNSINYLKSLT